MAETILSLTDVWKSYSNGDYVLKAINLRADAGEFVGIYGRSGSGKSTLLRLMGLLDSPTKGKVVLLGRDVSAMTSSEKAAARRDKLGFTFQGFNLIPHITALENIEVPMWLAKVDEQRRKERALALLSQFGLEKLSARYPRQLSHGEQQRVAAVRAMVNNPRVILADEPTSSLDDESARTFLELVSKLNREFGTAVVMTSTDPEEAKACNTAYRLSGGSLASER